ncbi:MAG: DNA recombination protein RmuC [Pseudohongiellaceae bacterium]|nr:DNA recombination protein RmuC [Pseudohongiellaceae bacterium]
MPISLELAVLIALVLIVLIGFTVLTLRKPEDRSAEILVLEERLSAKQSEIEALLLRLEETEKEVKDTSDANIAHREQISQLKTQLDEERKVTQEKLAILENSREKMTLEFKNIANDILEDKSRKFTASNRESISEILKPLNEKIQLFEKKVDDSYNQEAKERHTLAKEIKALQELNIRISEDAINLTNALKGENKTQGTWGEVILESILEKSGLVKGREYETQVNLKAEDGSRAQPDVIVHLPESKKIIIDAKVSLKSYEAYCSADEPEQRKKLLEQHVQSIQAHVKGLSNKEYQNLMGLNSLDFVLLFMPVEAAFSVAVQANSELFSAAFEKNIILVGPSTLLATLRTIQNIWRYEQQSQNAIEIATEAGRLYDKFVAFSADVEEIGSRIEATQKSYDKAHNKLTSGKGNLIVRIEKLKQLGAKASKKHSDKLLANTNLDALEQEDSSNESK